MIVQLSQAAVEVPNAGTISILGMLVVVVLSIFMSTLRKMSRERHQEESRREIAAYVAEGSMTADDAAKILAAGKGWDAFKKNC